MAKLDKVDGRWVNLEKPGGQVFFVGGGTVAYNGVGASDTFTGARPEEPLSTISQAHTLAVADRGDTIVVLPGTVTITAAVAITKADVTLTGYTVTGPKTRNPSIITCATDSVEMIAVDAANVVVENLTLTNTATTADVFLIDVGDSTSASGTVLRNLFIDCEGGANTVNAIRIGDGTVVSDYCTIEGVYIYDLDDIGITVSDASEGCVIRDCLIMDSASANIAKDCISIAADNTFVDNCILKSNSITAADAVISLAATAQDCLITNCHIWSNGADSHGILYADGATASCHNIFVTSDVLATTVDFTTDVDGLSGVIGWASAPPDGTISELINPNVA